jgi:hypothetical protein
MGFMDKAKKLAEQAQQKLDEAQQNFNQSASPQADAPQTGVRYDEHGRPIQEAEPAQPPPAPDPAEPAAAEEPQAAEPQPAEEPYAAEPPPPAESGGGQANASPDPFKPLQQ